MEMSLWSQLYFQDANSPIMENLIFFHEHAMFIILMIIFLIFFIMIKMSMNKLYNRFLMKGHMIEIIWTIIPMIMLFFLAFPSLKILYMTDEIMNPLITMKCLGHQWYWSYEYNDKFLKILDNNFDSFMINEYKISKIRLLESDNWILLPTMLEIRFLISSEDVIHSFTVPSLGIKADALPGRINELFIYSLYSGIFFGQCSEICGVNHSFMPIMIELNHLKNFFN